MMVALQRDGGFNIQGFRPDGRPARAGSRHTVAVLSPFIASGRLPGLAVSSATRSSAMPDVPTLSEQGFPGFSGLSWWGIFAPAGTPKPVITTLHTELVKIIS